MAFERTRILQHHPVVAAQQLVRRQGVGTLLGQVIESPALESLAVNGGLAVGVALLELVFALWVIAQGAAPWMHAMLLALWLPLTVGLTWHYGRRLRRWTEHRLLLTHEQEAQTLCEAMGLGELLKRMHGGLSRRIGETGWQLSHGERSRLFLARALLQGAPLTVMDESFAALDPQTLARCLSCAMANTDTWLVIAHP